MVGILGDNVNAACPFCNQPVANPQQHQQLMQLASAIPQIMGGGVRQPLGMPAAPGANQNYDSSFYSPWQWALMKQQGSQRPAPK